MILYRIIMLFMTLIIQQLLVLIAQVLNSHMLVIWLMLFNITGIPESLLVKLLMIYFVVTI